MERIKGILKRKSRPRSVEETSMEINPDPSALLPPELPLPPLNSTGATISDLKDNTHALMMEKIEQLTNEKYSLEDNLVDLKLKLERTQAENLDLRSISDDLQKALEMEKRRSRWQKKFYEKRIQKLTGLPVDSPEEPEASMELERAQSMEDLLECNSFYEGTIRSLVLVQEGKTKELEELKRFYEGELQKLNSEHEANVREILECSNAEVVKLIGENEAIIRDLLTGCEGLFDELKTEFNEECKGNVDLAGNGEGILVQFRAMDPKMKGVIIAGITVISVATAGWASWGFIVWVWPRLIIFAEVLLANPENSLMTLLAFLNSYPFQQFLKAWEEGKSLGECLKVFANTEFITSALRMAPDLFAQLKNMRKVPISK